MQVRCLELWDKIQVPKQGWQSNADIQLPYLLPQAEPRLGAGCRVSALFLQGARATTYAGVCEHTHRRRYQTCTSVPATPVQSGSKRPFPLRNSQQFSVCAPSYLKSVSGPHDELLLYLTAKGSLMETTKRRLKYFKLLNSQASSI